MKKINIYLMVLSAFLILLLISGCADDYKPIPSGTTANSHGTETSLVTSDTFSDTTSNRSQTVTETVSSESGLQTQTSTTAFISTTSTAALPYPLPDFKTDYDFFIGYDMTYDVVLFEKKADDRANPASVTKIITAIIAIEKVPLDTHFKVGSEIQRTPAYSSVAELVEGEVLTLDDLLYAMILPSGNDAALTIAVNTSRYLYGNELGSSEAIKKFMALCNDKLAELGCDNTHFSSPYGGTSSSHYTTARDILKLSMYAMDNEKFAEVTGTTKKSTVAITGEKHTWTNTNYLVLPSNKYYYQYATGVKNGKSESAAFCLSASAEKGGRKIFAVGLHAPSLSVRYGDIIRFFDAAFAG